MTTTLGVNGPDKAIQTPGAPPKSRPTSRRMLLYMVLAALALRLLVMAFLYHEQLDPSRDHWSFGYETGRIARSLAEGQGFASPLFGQTGPTAWITPVYPLIVAGIFKIFGIYSQASALVILSFNALTSALACIPIWFIARRCFGAATALYSGWAWAFFPYAIYFPVERVWETWLSTLLLLVLLAATLDLEQSQGLKPWIVFGVLWALEGLTSPVGLSVLPFWGIWVCYRRHRRGQKWFAPATLSALVFIAIVSPWFIRNALVFHRFIPFRGNFGLCLRVGTKGAPNDVHWRPPELGPWHNQANWELYRRLGELNYMQLEQQEAVQSIKTYPGWFAWTCLRRVVYIWTGFWSFNPAYMAQEPMDLPNIPLCTALTLFALFGLFRAFREKRPEAVLFLFMLLVFPASYYITEPELYYRRPLDPFLLILAVYSIAMYFHARRARAGQQLTLTPDPEQRTGSAS